MDGEGNEGRRKEGRRELGNAQEFQLHCSAIASNHQLSPSLPSPAFTIYLSTHSLPKVHAIPFISISNTTGNEELQLNTHPQRMNPIHLKCQAEYLRSKCSLVSQRKERDYLSNFT
jgi:hypothetical protein